MMGLHFRPSGEEEVYDKTGGGEVDEDYNLRSIKDKFYGAN
jgi:hypothetical protein